ncbi:FimV family protein [Polaromonas sp. YR568]|uniref:type IV pilus assembly protein FimV n=1 Tax=Polaromonas sp. YR568 TaxID=1855301 RepID=UPI00398C0F60
MKFAEKSLKYLFGALLMGLAASTLAASLGRIRGAAIVGRPLDVTLSVQLDSSENLSSVCVATDVFFGDGQVASDKVRALASQGSNATEVLVRIRTTAVVDEPVVTLYVREGCAQQYSRKYVLLAEMLGSGAGAVASTLPQAVAAQVPNITIDRDVRGKAGAVSAVQAEAVPRAGKASRTKPEGRALDRSVEPLSSAAMSSSLAAPPARTAGKSSNAQSRPSRPRLQLDPVDLTVDRDPVLKSSPELLTQPSTDAQQRSVAAALWHALNAQPQDVLRDSQRLKSLESDVAGMLAQSRKTEQAVTELRGQLEQARQERYSNWLVYVLGGILVLALLAAGFLWRRNRQHALQFGHGPWWDKDANEGPLSGFESRFATDAQTGPRSTGASTLAGRSPGPAVDLDIDALHFESAQKLPASSPSAQDRPAEPVEAGERPEFLPSLGGFSGMPRIVNAEELFDVQQQADFFLSLGNTDKAVEVLRMHITDNVETSALVYLDLFDLYHNLGRKDDYDALRKDFHRMFNAQVPAFDDYAADAHGLEFYVAALTRIESLWPTPKVLDVLEESIFRKPDSRSEVFSLAAYRELLLLHSIAKKIIARPAGQGDSGGEPATASALDALSAPRTTSFGPTSIQPLSAKLKETPPPLPTALPIVPAMAAHLEMVPAPDLTRPPVSPRLGLDIDLSLNAEGLLVPLPQITAADAPLEDVELSNMIEFDLDTPIPEPLQKA